MPGYLIQEGLGKIASLINIFPPLHELRFRNALFVRGMVFLPGPRGRESQGEATPQAAGHRPRETINPKTTTP